MNCRDKVRGRQKQAFEEVMGQLTRPENDWPIPPDLGRIASLDEIERSNLTVMWIGRPFSRIAEVACMVWNFPGEVDIVPPGLLACDTHVSVYAC